MTDAELEDLLADLESDRTERKESLADPGKIREAICAFANDIPDPLDGRSAGRGYDGPR